MPLIAIEWANDYLVFFPLVSKSFCLLSATWMDSLPLLIEGGDVDKYQGEPAPCSG